MTRETDPAMVVQDCMPVYMEFDKNCFIEKIASLSDEEFGEFCKQVFAFNKFAIEYEGFYHTSEIRLTEIPKALRKEYVEMKHPKAEEVTVSDVSGFTFNMKLEPGSFIQRCIDEDNEFNKYLFLKEIAKLNEHEFQRFCKLIREMDHHMASSSWGYATRDAEYIPENMKKDFFKMTL
jgi:hypothetical protein